MPAVAIARELALPRSTVYHLLTVLRDEGFVVHLREDRRYGLGVAALELGTAYSRQEALRRLRGSRPPLGNGRLEPRGEFIGMPPTGKTGPRAEGGVLGP